MDETTLKRARILMVDDEVGTTCLMTNFLNRIGYTRLESLSDSTKVFDKVRDFEPDLILLDLAMPGISGVEVLKILRRDESADNQVPVLVITGNVTAENKRRAFRAGATDLLTKPFDASEVSMRIRNLLQARFLRLEIEQQNRLLEDRVQERTAQLQQALDQIQRAQRQMVEQERLRAFAEMAGGVVHDFSNALMAIIGYSDMLLVGDCEILRNKETAVDYLRVINTAGRDASHVVSRLRDFYRPRDKADLFEPVDVNDLLSNAVLMTRPKWKGNSKPIVIETDLGQVSPVSGNPAELRELLTNLIFNAVDAMPDGGVITLRSRQVEQSVILEVADDGVGMTPEVRTRCLEPFYSTKGDNGTGLGLAMVFGIVQRHRGDIEIESGVGIGTTFRIRLPLGAPFVRAVDKKAAVLETDLLVAA
jgi:signal transduction histidine kinase